MEFQNKTSWELGGEGYNSNEFWSHKKLQKKPQKTNRLGLQEGCLDNHGFLDFIKNTKKSRNETVDRELEGKAWRSLDTNVLYSIHCTVQYHDEAFKGSRIGFPAVMIEVDYGQARFADTDIEESLTMDMFYTKIYEKQIIIQENRIVDKLKARVNKIDCMGPRLAPTGTEDKIDFLTMVSRANIDVSKIEVRLVDIDIMNMIVDEIRTEINEIDYMGPHLAPTDITPTSTERWTTTETE